MNDRLRGVNGKFTVAGRVVFVLALALAVGVGVSLRGVVRGQQQQPIQVPAVVPAPQELSRAFTTIAKAMKPAVVNIDVTEMTKAQANHLPQGLRIPGFGDNAPQKQRGTGSGVVISSDGFILTNNHVAGSADQIKVRLSDGREFKAKRVGTDELTDLAVIKIDAQNLPYAKLGDSDKLEQGEWVIALGSPFGLEQTMTAGIVSAIGRTIPGQPYENFIQTDASINPGNSGGPLINMSGEVVGINSMIYSSSGASQGIGFSIPSNLANRIYAELIKNGKITRGYLGVSLQPVSAAVARNAGYEGKGGALVADLAEKDSPAAEAGLQSGDVIIEFDRKPVTSNQQLTQIVGDTPVGRQVQVKYVRDGEVKTASVKLAERPETSALSSPHQGEEGPDMGAAASKLGIKSLTLTPQMAQQYGLKAKSGAVVEEVESGSPAEDAGLRQGDIIHRVNRTPVLSNRDLTAAIRALGDQKEVVLQVEREGRQLFLTVSLEM